SRNEAGAFLSAPPAACYSQRDRKACEELSVQFKLKSQIMDGPGISRALSRLASEIVERNAGSEDLLLVGIRRRGVPLAERIADKIAQLEGKRPPVGQLDITLYRDDLSTVGPRPVVNRTETPAD